MERDWVTFLHMGISFPRTGSLVLARPDMAINLFIGKSIHGFRMAVVRGSSHQLGKVPKDYGLEPRTVLLRTSGGVLG